MTKQAPIHLLRFDQLQSTNNQLKTLHRDQKLPEFTVVITNDQTAGKGQAGNSWESEPGKNLTFSLLLKPTYIEIQDQFILSKAVALGITDVFSKYSHDFAIKWPNDIYYQHKKIGGILIENTLSRHLISNSIVGIGLNINQETFTSEAPNPISLKNIVGKDIELTPLLSKIVNAIYKYLEEIKSGNTAMLNHQYIHHLYRKEGLHPYRDEHGEFMAQITGINPYGHLELQTQTKEKRTYAFKEVEFLINR